MFKPVSICDEQFSISARTLAGASRAEMMVIRMEDKACCGGVEIGLRRILARLEAISTIRIEGKRPTLKSLLYLESFLEDNAENDEQRLEMLDVFDFEDKILRNTALEVLRYLKALDYIYLSRDASQAFTLDTLLDIHSLSLYGCLADTSGTSFRKKRYELPGEMMASQVYEPPEPEDLPGLLKDLCSFINDEVYTPIVQSAFAHFQFESIKPFKSGLDRTGRLMCHAILHKRGLMQNIIAPIGLEPSIDTKSHAQSLLPYNFGIAVGNGNRSQLIDRWVDYCAWSAEVSIKAAEVYMNAMLSLKKQWLGIFGKPNKGSAPEALLSILSGTPVLTVKQAVSLTGKSTSSVSDAFTRLEKTGIVETVDNVQRSRVFVARTALELFDELDRRINPSEPVSRDSFIQRTSM